MSRNPEKTRNKLKTGLNEIKCCWKKTAKHTQMQILIYQASTSMLGLSASVVEGLDVGAESQPIFTNLGSNPGPRNYDFSPFPFYFLSFVTFKRSSILI
jgi:hypothetical protein